MKFIELFAGIGGFRLGLERAGHECVWANEFLEKPRSIYEYNFKHAPDGRDIRTVQPDEIPDCDLLVGGFPCATFSVAGRRTGFGTEDTRGTLFFEICRILRSKRIPYVFLENVKGLLNHDGGRTFGVIVASLDELGYDVQWECVNSKNFGVPQNRERVFIVGNLRGKPRPEVFPLGRCYAEDGLQDRKEQGSQEGLQTANSKKFAIGTLCNRLYQGDTNNFYLEDRVPRQVECDGSEEGAGGSAPDGSVRATHWRRNHFRDVKGDYTPTLTANMGTGGNNVPYIVRAVNDVLREKKTQNGRRIKEHNDPSFTLTAQDRHGVMIGTQLRKLTPLECERLQSLPDNWTKWYRDGSLVPDNQRYERCGRAVTVNVIEQIAKRLPL
jgi:DNA (cytosine-5)-methyltransferase 1